MLRRPSGAAFLGRANPDFACSFGAAPQSGLTCDNPPGYNLYMEKEAVISPWLFSSKRYDQESGFVYFGRRYYDPATARWITEDPLGRESRPQPLRLRPQQSPHKCRFVWAHGARRTSPIWSRSADP